MIYSNNAECGEIFSLQSLFSTVQVEKFSNYLEISKFIPTFADVNKIILLN